MRFLGARAVGEPTDGTWSFRGNARELARFDLPRSNLYLPEGQLRVYVPALKATVDDAGRLQRLEVRLHRYEPESSGFQPVANTALFEELVGSVSFELTDSDGTESNGGQRFSERISGTFDVSSFQYPWLYPGEQSTTEPALTYIIVRYGLCGTSYFFVFR